MAVLSSGFETGTDGATIATTDNGNPSKWDLVHSSPTYSRAHPAVGSSLGMFCNFTGPQLGVSWTSGSFGTVTEDYGRAYLLQTAPPDAGLQAFIRYRSVATDAFYFRCAISGPTTSGLGMVDGTTALGSFTRVIPSNQIVRLEWHVLCGTGTGAFEARLFIDPYSTTPVETKSFTGLTTTVASMNQVFFGVVGTVANWPLYIDEVLVGAADWPGPKASSDSVNIHSVGTLVVG